VTEEIITRRRVVGGDDTAGETVVARRGLLGYSMAQIVYFIFGLIEALLALRFVLVLLGASTASTFVSFVYNLSAPLVAPFFGMFATSPAFGASRIELETLIALIVYAIVSYLIARLLEAVP